MPILTLIMANLPALISAGGSIAKMVHDIRDTAMQTGEWTDDYEAQFQAALAQDATRPEWQQDKQ